MLSDNAKDHIWAEERYRREVQDQLNQEREGKGRSAKLWKFLNSSFGIWLLATVAVGALSWGYTKWEAARAAEALFKSSITKLDIEINSRLQGICDGLSTNTEGSDAFRFHHLVQGKEFSVYAEFKERDVRPLMIELSYMVPENQRPEIANALRALAQLYVLAPSAPYDSGRTVSMETIGTARSLVMNGIAMRRWPLVK